MKTTILASALLMSLTFSSFAQEPEKAGIKKPKQERKNMTADEKAQKGADWAAKKLGLNADQKAKWLAASKERIAANEPIKSKLQGSTTKEERMALHAQAKANNEKFDTTVKGFLTPEQAMVFEKIKKERQDGHRKKLKGQKEDESKELPPAIED